MFLLVYGLLTLLVTKRSKHKDFDSLLELSHLKLKYSPSNHSSVATEILVTINYSDESSIALK